MNHSIIAEGFGIRHRPVRMEDAPFLVWLRNLEHAKGKVGDSAVDVPTQQAWLKEYFERNGDYYFVVETACAGIPVGTWGIYNMKDESAEIGRWIAQPKTPTVIPSIIPGLDIAFHRFGLRTLRTKVVSTNKRVILLDKQMGFQETHSEPAAQIIGGKSVDMIHMVMTAEDWPQLRKTLMPMALMLEVQVRKWEQDAARTPHFSPVL
ncbi:MAG: GNAT family protein [Verrucomicrobia bacterium]|nr:GNAT family protein [Verrucomicrobiota bacterium]